METTRQTVEDLWGGVEPGIFAGRELDLTRPEDRARVTRQFGGEGAMKERYPGLWGLLGAAAAAGAPRASSDQGFQNKAKVLDVGYDQTSGTAYALGTMLLTGPAQRLYLTLDIYADGVPVAHNARFFNGKSAGEIEIQSAPLDPLPAGKLYQGVLQATWQPGTDNTLRAMLAVSSSASRSAGAEDPVENIVLTDPVHRRSSPSGPVTVAYGRQAADLDYYYEETRDPATGEETVLLEMTGRVDLKDGYHVSSVTDIGAALDCTGYGSVIYLGAVGYGRQGDAGVVAFPLNGGASIGWQLERNWRNQIPDSVRYGNRVHDLDLSFSYRCQEDATLHEVLISSKLSDLVLSQPHTHRAPQMHLYWGCLAEGTPVDLADGTSCPVEQLKPGTLVATPGGGSARVKCLVSGTEQNIYLLRLENGMEVRATRNHPFSSPNGFVATIDLDSRSVLDTRTGPSAVVYCYPETWARPVYGVELEEGDRFFAGGVVSGTNEVTYRLDSLCADEHDRLTVSEEAIRELERLEADFAAGRL